MKIFLFFLILFNFKPVLSNEVTNWLKAEIDFILQAYENKGNSNKDRFLIIENTINNNFAGAGIAKFVAGKAWDKSEKSTKKNYIKNFKRHLALNIASMLQGYSNQDYNLTNSSYDSKNKVSLVNMEIINDNAKLNITWRVKKSKERFFVIDLLVSDISLVVTKRSEFNSMLKSVDFDLTKFNIILFEQNKISFNKIIN